MQRGEPGGAAKSIRKSLSCSPEDAELLIQELRRVITLLEEKRSRL